LVILEFMATKRGEKNIGFDAPEQVGEEFLNSITDSFKKKKVLTALCRYWLSLSPEEQMDFYNQYSIASAENPPKVPKNQESKEAIAIKTIVRKIKQSEPGIRLKMLSAEEQAALNELRKALGPEKRKKRQSRKTS